MIFNFSTKTLFNYAKAQRTVKFIRNIAYSLQDFQLSPLSCGTF